MIFISEYQGQSGYDATMSGFRRIPLRELTLLSGMAASSSIPEGRLVTLIADLKPEARAIAHTMFGLPIEPNYARTLTAEHLTEIQACAQGLRRWVGENKEWAAEGQQICEANQRRT